jgi:hypothetical protein
MTTYFLPDSALIVTDLRTDLLKFTVLVCTLPYSSVFVALLISSCNSATLTHASVSSQRNNSVADNMHNYYI